MRLILRFSIPSLPLVRSTVMDSSMPEAKSGMWHAAIADYLLGALNDSGRILPSKNATAANTIYGEKRVYEYFVCDVGKTWFLHSSSMPQLLASP